MKYLKFFILTGMIFLLSFSSISCSKKQKVRINIGNDLNITESKNENDNEKFVWVEAQFEIPDELKNKDLGVYSAYIKAATKVWINGTFVGEFGKFPPHGFSCGFQAHYYFLPKSSLIQEGTNKLLMKVWVGGGKAISKDMFIGETSDANRLAELKTFYSTKINVFFAGIMFLVSLLYIIMYRTLKKHNKQIDYLIFALLNIHTLLFIIPFFASELPLLSSINVSYLIFLKCTFCYGAVGTVFFANSFIIYYLDYTQKKKDLNIRIYITCFSTLLIICAPTLTSLAVLGPIAFIIDLTQFYFTIPLIYKAFKEPEKNDNAKKLLIGFTPVLVTLLFDLLIRNLLKNDTLPFLAVYGWQITIIVFLIYLIITFNNMYLKNSTLKNRLSEFNENLEEIVAQRTKELQDTNFVLSRGLEAVANVQKNFLPQQKIEFAGWEIAAEYKPLSDNVSGDLYDYYFTKNSLHGLGIFDVSGHGIPAGLMTILAKGIITQHFLNGKEQNLPLEDVMVNINDTYIREKVNVENYITGLLFRFSDFNNKDECTVEIANAGHPYPLFYNSKTKKITEIKPTDEEKQYGMIGIEGLDVSFSPTIFKMNKDDIIVCFTDGITEAQNNYKKDFGTEKIKKIISENSDKSAEQILNKIFKSFKTFTGMNNIKDDFTCIVLKRNNSKDFIEEL